MAFDVSKFVVLKSESVEVSDTTMIIVEKYTYDGGEEKIKVGKIITKANGTFIRSNDVGGMSPEIAACVAEAIANVLN